MSKATRFLMCPPEDYNAHFLFNPWLDYTDEVNVPLARRQWNELKQAISTSGSIVDEIPSSSSESAMVFTRDNALVYDTKKVLLLRSIGPRGVREPALLKTWFQEQGFSVTKLPKGMHLEGGNMIFRDPYSLIAGYKQGEDVEAYRWFADFYTRETGCKLTVTFVRLMNKKYLHLDMAIGFLGNKTALVYPPALNLGKTWRTSSLWSGRNVIELSQKEYFGANVVLSGTTAIGTGWSDQTKEQIRSHGFEVQNIDLSEFIKGGGGAHCLTLELVPMVGDC